MHKKLAIAVTALTALAAFVLPPSASAAENEPTLVEGGLVVKVGEKIVATLTQGTEVVFWNTATTSKQVTCNHATLTGKVTANGNANTVEATIETTEFNNGSPAAPCTAGAGTAKVTIGVVCLYSDTNMTKHEFRIEGGDCTGKLLGVTVTMEFGGFIGTCKYITNAPIKGDYTTNSDSAKLTTRDTAAGSGSKLEEGGGLCPTSGVLAMSFDLETENATPITVVDKTP
jgi:hypothetical protein